jgi:hypothetical protein
MLDGPKENEILTAGSKAESQHINLNEITSM